VLFHLEQRPIDMGVTAVALGEVFVERQEWARAEACFRYGLAKAETANSLRHKLYAYGKLARLHLAQEQLDRAAESFVKAIEYAKQIGELSGEQSLRLQYGKLLERLNRLDDAEVEYRIAIELQDKIRGRFRSIERRAQFQQHTEDSTTNIVRLLVKRPRRNDALSRAFIYADGARSRTLVELLSRRPVRQPASLPSELSTREEELLSRLTGLETAAATTKEAADQYLSLIGALGDLWNKIAKIDESCRAYVDLRRTPFVQLKVITKLLVA
jgi:tetratricopeptide (TPR) repeat protein